MLHTQAINCSWISVLIALCQVLTNPVTIGTLKDDDCVDKGGNDNWEMEVCMP